MKIFFFSSSRFICILYPYLEMLYRKEGSIFRNSIGTPIESILKAYINLSGRPTEKISSGARERANSSTSYTICSLLIIYSFSLITITTATIVAFSTACIHCDVECSLNSLWSACWPLFKWHVNHSHRFKIQNIVKGKRAIKKFLPHQSTVNHTILLV